MGLIAQLLSTLASRVDNFFGRTIMITLNQEEIQLACKRFVKEHYGLDMPDEENPAHGILLRVVPNDFPRNTARIEADIETKS